MFNEVFSSMIAGLGLLFIALKILESCLHELTSGHVREIIKKNTSTGWQAAIWGGVLGLVAGDPAVVGFIAASLFTCKSIPLSRALTMSMWSNVGACCLYFIVFIDIDLLVLYFIGLTGFAYYLEKPFRGRHLLGSIFAICLMLYALTIMKSQSDKIVDIPFIANNLHSFQQSYFKPFIISTLLTLAVQGADIIILVLIVNLFNGHVLTLDQALFMLFGMNLGLALINLIITLSLKGVMKQILFIQVAVDVVISVGFSLCLALELYTGIPMLKAFALFFFHNVWAQMIFIIFASNVFTCVTFSIFMEPISRLMAYLFPSTNAVDLAEPKYLGDIHIKDGNSAIDLINREIFDLLQRLPKNLEYKLTTNNRQESATELELRHQQYLAVIEAIDKVVKELSQQTFDPLTANKMLMTSDRLQIAIALEEGIFHLTHINLPDSAPESTKQLALRICEAQQAQLETVLEAISSKEEEEVVQLINATANTKTVIGTIRQEYLKNEHNTLIEIKAKVLEMTSLFERNVWLLRRLAYQFIPKDAVKDTSLLSISG